MKKEINKKFEYISKSKPLVSVIIPSFNRFDYLKNAIQSIFKQTYDNFEVIIINDGSTDKRYLDIDFGSKVHTVHLKQNQKEVYGFGPGSIRNHGTNKANGDLLAFLDDDDIWLEEKLDRQLQEMSVNNIGMSSTEAFFGKGIYDKNKKYPLYIADKYIKDIKHLYRKTNYINQNNLPKLWDYEFTNIHNCFVTSSVIIEKKTFDILGGFRGLPLWADYDCWLGLQELTDSVFIKEPLVYYDSSHGDGRNYEK
jgi:glycosyltransferase involved in cell wall biosynthesis